MAQFLIGFEQGRGLSERGAAALNERYVKALSGLPLVAIQAAIGRFDGAATLLPWKPSFRPTPAEMTAEVREGLTNIRKRLIYVRRVLGAEVYDPPTAEQGEALAAAARGWSDDRGVATGEAPRAETAEELDARLKALWAGGARLSAEGLAAHKGAAS